MAKHIFFRGGVPSVSLKLAGAAAPKRVVFCDFDGPIVDVSERYYQTYCLGLSVIEQAQLKANNNALTLQPLSKAQFWKMKRSRAADIEIAIRSGLPTDLFEPFMQQVEGIVNHSSLLQWDCLQPGALGALHYFKQRDMRLVLVTLRHPQQVQDFLQVQGLEPLIDEVYGALDVNAALANRVEQKRELLGQAIAQQKAQGHFTQNSWMIGDTEADILAGQSAGLSTAALACGARSKAHLQHLQPSKIYDCLMTAAIDLGKAPALKTA